MAKVHIRGRNLWAHLILSIWSVLVLIPLWIMVINSFKSKLAIYIAMGMPIGVFVLTEFIRTVPPELTQAAYIDGAGNFRIYRQIVLPLTRPAMATVAIFNLVVLWNDLWFPLIFIRSESQRTLMLGVTRLFGQYQTDWTLILSTLTVATVPIVLLYILMAKQFIAGLTAGAVKG
ncbi:MAG: carbohydrate ABC transporter permease [Alkalispirochaeta sp.]